MSLSLSLLFTSVFLKDARQLEFFACRDAILKLWSSLDQIAATSFEEAVREGDTRTFVLSEDNMDSLNLLKAKVQTYIHHAYIHSTVPYPSSSV